MEYYKNQIIQIIIKAIVPAMVFISLKVAIMIADKKATTSGIIVSYMSGLTMCGFSVGLVELYLDGVWLGAAMGMIALSSEKFARFLIYDVDLASLFGNFIKTYIGKYIK